jgi:hypothetical protein
MIKKIANAIIAEPSLSAADWERLYGQFVFGQETEIVPNYFKEYLEFCLSHVSMDSAETHHILPRSIYPDFVDSSWNLIELSPADHYWSHYLLAKALPDCLQVQLAFYLMSGRDDLRGNPIQESELPELQRRYAEAADKIFRYALQVKQKDGKIIWVNRDDSRVASGELKHFNAGKITVRDVNGDYFMVFKDDPRIASGEFIHLLKGKITVRDPKTEEVFSVKKDDPRFLSGELIHINKGTVCVRDKDGNKFRVPMNDERILSGELVSITKGIGNRKKGANKGTVQVIDATGRRFRVSNTDSRWLSGELISIRKGQNYKKGHVTSLETKERIRITKIGQLNPMSATNRARRANNAL